MEQNQSDIHEHLSCAKLELNIFKPDLFSANTFTPEVRTPAEWFSEKFPSQAQIYGCPFLEMREKTQIGNDRITPLALNIDFFAGILGGDERLGHKVVYYENEMQFYYFDPRDKLFKPTTPEKLQNSVRALLVRCAQELNADVHKLNLFHEYRTDKITKQIVHRAKSILAADQSFFSATSNNMRLNGLETHERLARVFIEQVLEREPGQILTLSNAYLLFMEYLKHKNMPELKRPLFKGVVVPIVKDLFECALRNDLMDQNNKQQQGWKGIRAVGLDRV